MKTAKIAQKGPKWHKGPHFFSGASKLIFGRSKGFLWRGSNSMTIREKIGKKLLEHPLNYIQKIFQRNEFYGFQKTIIFFTDPSKINQLFF